MKRHAVVTENIPMPARNLPQLIQSTLKCSNKIALKLIRDGFVEINDRVCTVKHRHLRVGDKVCVDDTQATAPIRANPRKRISGNESMEVLYDDQHIVVVNKPAALLTVPTQRRESRTLIGEVSRFIDRQRKHHGDESELTSHRKYPSTASKPMFSAFCVHRLDRGVSGILVFGKNLESAEALRNQFAARKPQRQYVAIVTGRLEMKSGTFRSHLATDDDLNQRSVDASMQDSKLAITHFRRQSVFQDYSFVQVNLETGRRNQIRVHFAEAGHPVLGDPRYSSGLNTTKRWPHKRLALHAESLGFYHPVTDEPLEFVTQWPTEFRKLASKKKK